MSTRLGLALGAEHVRLVVERRGAVLCVGTECLAAHDSLGDAVSAVIRNMDAADPRRAAFTVAVGPHASQVREIEGLPSVSDPRVRLGMVREERERFFLGARSSIRVVGVVEVSSDRLIAAAIEETVMREVVRAAYDLGVRRLRFAPTVSLLPLLAPTSPVTWSDGYLTSEVTVEGGHLRSVRTFLSHPVAQSQPVAATPPRGPSVDGLDLSAWPLPDARLADALAAAISPRVLPFVVRATDVVAPPRRERIRRLVVPVGTSLLGAVLFVSAPAKDQWDASRFTATLEAIDPRQRALADSVTKRLAEVTAVLDDASELVAGRILVTELLAAVATALPADCALAAAVVDHHDVSLSLLAPRIEEVIPSLSKVKGLVDVRLEGEVSPVTVHGREVERAVVRFGVDANAFRLDPPSEDPSP